jgi:hypothetical protein
MVGLVIFVTVCADLALYADRDIFSFHREG